MFFSGWSDSSAGYLKPRKDRTETSLWSFLRTFFYLAFAPRLGFRHVTSLENCAVGEMLLFVFECDVLV